jgi:hypothetical protein
MALALKEGEKAIPGANQPQIQAETWLFDPRHKVKSSKTTNLSSHILAHPHPLRKLIIQNKGVFRIF